MRVRRIVTGHTPDGKATVVDDALVDGITLDLVPGSEFHRIWERDDKPTFPDDGTPQPTLTYFPPVDGFRFGAFTVGPDGRSAPEGLDVAAALAQMEERLPGMPGHMEPDNPGMHTTDTVDYLYVASGSATLELDDGEEIDVHPGDTVIQNGTRHRWHNRTDQPCVLVFAILGAHRIGPRARLPVNEAVDTYFAAWNEPAADRRAELLARVMADDCTYVDPTTEQHGRQGLCDHIGSVLARYPGQRVVLTSALDVHHDRCRFHWRMIGAEGTEGAESIDFMEFAADGSIRRVVGFFGPVPAGDDN